MYMANSGRMYHSSPTQNARKFQPQIISIIQHSHMSKVEPLNNQGTT